ncbi:AbrB family transcriptional regulator [Desulfosporosinus sp. FKB]|uniref:AbrB family transcriptional regulator n=1 Tax=Desulfosporosinus sp. FKB TaxID=1969835 RepID=UPI000B49A105|nr:AbrB family transcriptional regulator [Desulfosporosinus sp. FKB]
MKAKPIYKILDDKGRVLIPKALRTAAEIEHGDIVRLGVQKGVVTAKKVDLIEIGDQSPEAVEAFVRAAIRDMPKETQIGIAARLLEMIEQRKGQHHE